MRGGRVGSVGGGGCAGETGSERARVDAQVYVRGMMYVCMNDSVILPAFRKAEAWRVSALGVS